ncbi:twitching motility protein PilU [Noviherbaspirillum humi]|uniref:Twitching motility protein PilU n=1 Tax=Noviherbaspirillum humi TaxID=1688639 RepID=A0A239H8B2_9BURK|nr:PilT/PilU family type 4a pilus ATPase [Noviherbaspirillum humi]SNS76494.1 twitching motility protein PilU [Noviherbaspirillum humi]
MAIERLFQLMKEKKASDLFLSPGAPVHVKINGQVLPVNQQKLDDVTVRALLGEVVPLDQMRQLDDDHELNLGIPVRDIGNFRLSAFRQRGSVSAVFRFIPMDIPALADLKLPPALADIVMEKRGLVLVTGATGSGKSTTIASMLDYRNSHKFGHILTLEDPIEYLFQSRKSVVNQREVGTDAKSLSIALRNALRQAPDCILIGEIRDTETMAEAIAYAQSGHLVLATLHANNSYHALNRVISFFPLETRQLMLSDLAATLKAVLSQRLVRSVDGGRRAAVEVLLNTSHIAELIEEGEFSKIKEAMEKSISPGSQTFEQSLMQLISEGAVSVDEALANADSATNLYWLLNNQTAAKQEAEPEPPKDDGPTFTEFTLNI